MTRAVAIPSNTLSTKRTTGPLNRLRSWIESVKSSQIVNENLHPILCTYLTVSWKREAATKQATLTISSRSLPESASLYDVIHVVSEVRESDTLFLFEVDVEKDQPISQ